MFDDEILSSVGGGILLLVGGIMIGYLIKASKDSKLPEEVADWTIQKVFEIIRAKSKTIKKEIKKTKNDNIGDVIARVCDPEFKCLKKEASKEFPAISEKELEMLDRLIEKAVKMSKQWSADKF